MCMQNRLSRLKLVVAAVTLLVGACAGGAESASEKSYTLVGSTACDAAIKNALAIPAETPCDFIRWNLRMSSGKDSYFTLDVNFGVSQPNTLGFIDGGRRINASGRFTEIKLADRREVFRLKAGQPAVDLSLVRINSNLFHVLSPDGKLMVGNGGWSYSLNRVEAVVGVTIGSVSLAPSEPAKAAQVTFDGRTPCGGLGPIIDVREGSDCLKIKWRVVLNRDPSTLAPTTFTINGIIPDRRKNVQGRWSESRLPFGAIIYKLEPEGGVAPISFYAVEDNLLFFLDSVGRPLVGNKDFSFTLNRKTDAPDGRGAAN
jgi:hypothetical protein